MRTIAIVAGTFLVAQGAHPQQPPPVRSVVFDTKAADFARLREQPLYVESIVVEGRDPDARRSRPQAFEQRFAAALLAPPPSAVAGLRFLDATPCMSMPSTWNTLGNSYAPVAGCPR